MIFSALLPKEPLSNLATFSCISWRGRKYIPTFWFDRQALKTQLILNFKQYVLSHRVDSVVFFHTEVWLTLSWLESFTIYKSFGDFFFAELSAMALAWATQQGEKVGKSILSKSPRRMDSRLHNLHTFLAAKVPFRVVLWCTRVTFTVLICAHFCADSRFGISFLL